MPKNDRPLSDRPAIRRRRWTDVSTIWLFAALSTCVAATAFVVVFVFVVLPAERQDQVTNAWIEDTHRVIDAVNGIMASAADAETGQRGFLLTQDSIFLEVYDDGIKTIHLHFATAQRLTVDSPGQQNLLRTIRDQIDARLAVLAQTVEMGRGGDFGRAIDIVRQGNSKALMDALRRSIAEMIAAEDQQLRGRRMDFVRAREHTNRVILFLVLLGSCAVMVGGASITAGFLAANASRLAIATAAERVRLLNMVNFVPVMMLDLGGVVRFWSAGCTRLYGWTAEQAVGQPSGDLLRTVASVSSKEIETALLRTGEWNGELCHRAQNGDEVIVLANKVLQRDVYGGRLGDNLIIVDVTRLRHAETALNASEAQYRAVVDAAADAIIIAHIDGRIDNVNPAGLRMFGYDRIQDLIGSDLGVLMPATEAARHGGYIANRQPGAPPRVITVLGRELLALRRDGTQFPIDLSVGSFGLDGNQYLTGIVRDTSDRREAEAALRDSEAQLRELRKMEVVGRLVAGVAHDFNNVLQCVAGGLEMVLDGVDAGTAAHEFADIAMTSAMRGADLTNHLLAYARKQVLQPKEVDVAQFLSEMQALLSHTLGQHIVITIRVEQVSIRVDPGLLQTALLNLAINASHAMPKGGTLLLEGRVDSADAEYVVVGVTDTGAGMDEATLAQVFEPFFTTKGRDGTGLGLSMVQGFAAQSGGAVSIRSSLGKGTVVELRLPAARTAIGPAVQPASAVTLQGSGRILLVDDNADVRLIIEAFLKGAGFQVVVAARGDEALAYLASGERFDLLVTDHIMPGMNGMDLIEHIRAIQPGLAALVITGFAAPGDVEVLPESVTVLRKPFQRPRLIETVLRAMGQKPVPALEATAPGRFAAAEVPR